MPRARAGLPPCAFSTMASSSSCQAAGLGSSSLPIGPGRPPSGPLQLGNDYLPAGTAPLTRTRSSPVLWNLALLTPPLRLAPSNYRGGADERTTIAAAAVSPPGDLQLTPAAGWIGPLTATRKSTRRLDKGTGLSSLDMAKARKAHLKEGTTLAPASTSTSTPCSRPAGSRAPSAGKIKRKGARCGITLSDDDIRCFRDFLEAAP